MDSSEQQQQELYIADAHLQTIDCDSNSCKMVQQQLAHCIVENEDVLRNVGEDTQLWSPSRKCILPASQVLANKTVLFYFSAHWCGPCKRFTPMLTELYKHLRTANNNASVEDFEVVFCSMDAFECEYNHYSKNMPWWCLPFQSPITTRLANLYKADGIPSLVVVDRYGSVITANGVNHVASDPLGAQFPWRPKTLVELLPEYYLSSSNSNNNNNNHVQQQQGSQLQPQPQHLPMRDLDDKYLLIYAGGQWCAPCRCFAKKLAMAYETLRRHRQDFEILFLSSDKDEQAFSEFFAQMPFGAIPYQDRTAKAAIANKFGIVRIPTLLMFGPRPADGGDRPLINADVRNIFECPNIDYITEFPYQPKRYGDLNCTTHDINKCKSVVVLGEYCDDCEQEDVEEVLKCAADSYMGTEDIKFFWVFQPTPFSQTLRSALNLPQNKEQPAMMLLDFPDNGGYYMWEQDEPGEITTSSVLEFLDRPGKRLQI